MRGIQLHRTKFIHLEAFIPTSHSFLFKDHRGGDAVLDFNGAGNGQENRRKNHTSHTA